MTSDNLINLLNIYIMKKLGALAMAVAFCGCGLTSGAVMKNCSQKGCTCGCLEGKTCNCTNANCGKNKKTGVIKNKTFS